MLYVGVSGVKCIPRSVDSYQSATLRDALLHVRQSGRGDHGLKLGHTSVEAHQLAIIVCPLSVVPRLAQPLSEIPAPGGNDSPFACHEGLCRTQAENRGIAPDGHSIPYLLRPEGVRPVKDEWDPPFPRDLP